MKLMIWRCTAMLLLLFCSLLSPQASRAQAQADRATDSGWPQQIQSDGNTITIYQPQIEWWDGNQLQSRAAVAVETPTSAQPIYGVINTALSVQETAIHKENVDAENIH